MMATMWMDLKIYQEMPKIIDVIKANQEPK